jgi:hypothetical protein
MGSLASRAARSEKSSSIAPDRDSTSRPLHGTPVESPQHDFPAHHASECRATDGMRRTRRAERSRTTHGAERDKLKERERTRLDGFAEVTLHNRRCTTGAAQPALHNRRCTTGVAQPALHNRRCTTGAAQRLRVAPQFTQPCSTVKWSIAQFVHLTTSSLRSLAQFAQKRLHRGLHSPSVTTESRRHLRRSSRRRNLTVGYRVRCRRRSLPTLFAADGARRRLHSRANDKCRRPLLLCKRKIEQCNIPTAKKLHFF